MPAKGSTYALPDRHQALNNEMFKQFKEENPDISISFKEFSDIIKTSNKKIYDAIIEDEEGFKLPENLGYLCVTKYKTRKKAINWADTKKYGKKIYHLNLHSFGYSYHIKWFKTGICRFLFNEVFKFAPHRHMRRDVAAKVKEGKIYHNWQVKDFWDFNRLEKLLNKKLKSPDEYYKPSE